MMDIVLSASALSRDYGKKRVLDSVDLEMEPGRVVALLGPNGAGKSTLLRLLAGLIEPTEGQSTILGEFSRLMSPETRGRLAVTIDGCEPPPWADVGRLIRLQAEAASGFRRQAAEAFIQSRGVELKTPYGILSKGQKYWTLAGLALMSGARVLLLDEPADGLDPAARRALYDTIRETANETDCAILLATHLLHDSERIADDVAILHEGRLALFASIEDLREQVFEIDVPDEEPAPEFAEGTELLGMRREPGGALYWVRRRAGPDDAAGGDTRERGVDLETIYLALTEHTGMEEAK